MAWVTREVQTPPSLEQLHHHAGLNLVVRSFNQGTERSQDIDMRMWIDTAYKTNITFTLAPWEVRYAVGKYKTHENFFLEADINAQSKNNPRIVDLVISHSGPPGSLLNGGPPGGTTAPFKTGWEPSPCDNWIRFRWYVFDPANPTPTLRDTLIGPPENVDCENNGLCPCNRDMP